MNNPNEIPMTIKFGLDTSPIPLEVNTSQSQFDAESKIIFHHAWLNMGREELVPKRGDYVVRDVAILKTSVLIVRGRDGVVRAFHNMCKHRGNKVVGTGVDHGSAKGFSCSFHGWTYNPEGELVVVPDEDQFFDFDKSTNGLTPIATEIWEGFVFINTAPKESLREWLEEISDSFTGYFDGAKHVASYQAEVKTNWKVVLDAFVEAYHAPFLHGRNYPDALTGETNPLCHLPVVKLFPRHRMMSIEANPNPTLTRTESILLEHVDGIFSAMIKPIDLATQPPGVNPAKLPNWAFDAYTIFPNFYLAPMRVFQFVTYHFWPIAPDRTLWQTDHYVTPPRNAAERIALEFSKSFARDVQREDLITLENTQTMLESGAMTHMFLSDQEILVRHGYKVVEEALRSGV
ncbi:MAG: aromatic ring-hydroxylating dioxygenase subunit alpha [Rugosibacter sp.]|nr:MAG: aromatic ring-hydroxylating dioxygenase subunit alpha [Rugosibacter sp.]